jgi:hypothetical protein
MRSETVILAYTMRFGISYPKRPIRDWPDAFLAQLSYCRSDEARRLILGISC